MNRLSRHRVGDSLAEGEATIPRRSLLDTLRRQAAGPSAGRMPPNGAAPQAGEQVPTPSAVPSLALPPAGLWTTFGPLTPYLMREGVTDLFITGDGSLWSDGGPGGLHRIPEWRADEPETRRLAIDLIARGGRHIDEASPFVDVRLHDGVRVHALLRKPLYAARCRRLSARATICRRSRCTSCGNSCSASWRPMS